MPAVSHNSPFTARVEPAARDPWVVLMPVFNDQSAAESTVTALHDVLCDEAGAGRLDHRVILVLADDGSSQPPAPPNLPPTSVIDEIRVLRLRRNLGHQRAIAIGLAYIAENIPCRGVVVMDCDGEDNPADVPRLISRAEEEGMTKIVFARRRRRAEGPAFRLGYLAYRALYRVLTGRSWRVGNFSVIPRRHLESLTAAWEIWNHYAAAVFKTRLPCCEVPADRVRRSSGRSGMGLTGLIQHGLSALSVHAETVGIRLLLAATACIAAAFAVLILVIAVRLLTPWAIPGWATSAAGLACVMIVQGFLLSVLFCFMTLAGRQGTTFIPIRDYRWFIGEVIRHLPTSPAAAFKPIPLSDVAMWPAAEPPISV
ncbi:MAG: glycosyltransferase family 2 protein [Thermogutta sp.]|nr:glycosyltransferase family 2 protein [Thermogutta sp.]